MTAATLAADAAPEPANSTTRSQSPASSAPPSKVLRFLRLCHCRRPGDRSGILPADIRHRADAQRLPHLRHRLPRPSAGLGAVRPLRRPHRAQVNPGRLAAADGGVHHPDRRPPRLRQHRLLGAVAALRAALRPGPRPRRRVGRRRAAGHGERAGRQARLVRHVSPARPVDRLPRRQRPVPGLAMLLSEEQFREWGWRIRSCSARRWLWSASTYA